MLISAELVLFDLDETLVDHLGAQLHAAEWLSERLRPDLTPSEALAQWRHIEQINFPRYLSGELGYQQMRRIRLTELAPQLLGSDEAALDAIFDEYRALYEAGWAAFDDALPCLDRARDAGLKVAILTNGDQAGQELKARRSGVSDDTPVFAASALPAAKPSPLAYAAVLDRLGHRPEHTVMVGDDHDNDVAAARAAGLSAAWLQRPGREDALVRDEDSPASVIRTLDELQFSRRDV